MYFPYYLINLERVNGCVGILWIPGQPLHIYKKAQEDNSATDCFQHDGDVEVEDGMRIYSQERGTFCCIVFSQAVLSVAEPML